MELLLGNIVETEADAIVTPAYSDLLPTPGIRQAIFDAADGDKLREACRRIGRCPIGRAVVTPSFGLPCRYLIHAVGPGWYSGRQAERTVFAGCYQKALYQARAWECRTVALPLMFSGEYHLPRALALQIVIQVVRRFERHHPEMQVRLVLYKPGIYRMARQALDEAEQAAGQQL